MMRFDIMTLFPDLVRMVLAESVIGRAQKSGAITSTIGWTTRRMAAARGC